MDNILTVQEIVIVIVINFLLEIVIVNMEQHHDDDTSVGMPNYKNQIISNKTLIDFVEIGRNFIKLGDLIEINGSVAIKQIN